MPFQMYQHSFPLEKSHGASPDPRKVQMLINMPPPKLIKEFQSFLGILNYLSKFSPVTAEVCEQLGKLTMIKAEWPWDRMYQDLYDKAKKLATKDACMKLYNALKLLYLETDASGISLGARLLQVRKGINCQHDKLSIQGHNTAIQQH